MEFRKFSLTAYYVLEQFLCQSEPEDFDKNLKYLRKLSKLNPNTDLGRVIRQFIKDLEEGKEAADE